MRGNLVGSTTANQVSGSIPAHAGQPCIPMGVGTGVAVYPRACGATIDDANIVKAAQGLSPRMRGNHVPPTSTPTPTRSIPAHAGQPPRQD